MPDNQDIIDHANEMREEIDPPEERDYMLLIRGESIRVKFDGGGLFGTEDRPDVFYMLDYFGYRLRGGNFDTGLLVFEKP